MRKPWSRPCSRIFRIPEERGTARTTGVGSGAGVDAGLSAGAAGAALPRAFAGRAGLRGEGEGEGGVAAGAVAGRPAFLAFAARVAPLSFRSFDSPAAMPARYRSSAAVTQSPRQRARGRDASLPRGRGAGPLPTIRPAAGAVGATRTAIEKYTA